jgi:hypothetical protein
VTIFDSFYQILVCVLPGFHRSFIFGEFAKMVTSKKFGSGLPPSLLYAEVSPNLAEFTQGVSNPGAQVT